jgi:hypothetical protein
MYLKSMLTGVVFCYYPRTAHPWLPIVYLGLDGRLKGAPMTSLLRW